MGVEFYEVGLRNQLGVLTCPICGKKKWCCLIVESGKTTYSILCNRSTEGNTIGVDGMYYVHTGTTKNGSAVFTEANALAKEKGISCDKKAFRKSEVKNVVEVKRPKALPAEKLDPVYKDLMSMLILETKHEQMLLDDGWSKQLIKQSGVKSFPVTDYRRWKEKIHSRNPKRSQIASRLVDRHGGLLGVPGAYIAKKPGESDGYWTFATGDGMIFPCYDINKRVSRLRVRLDNPTKSGGKYRSLNSWYVKEGQDHNTYLNGTPAGNQLSYFYDEAYLETPSYWQTLHITEGYKKGFVINQILGCPSVSMPGVNNASLINKSFAEFMKNRGVQFVCIDFDADYKQNKHVYRALLTLGKTFSDAGFLVGVSDWDEERGKGIDDYLLAGYQLGYKSLFQVKEDMKEKADEWKLQIV